MQIVDSHCHIHQIAESEYNDPTHEKWKNAGVTDADRLIADATAAGVDTLICVGTDVNDSHLAVEFAWTHDNCFASIGIHPHEAKRYAGMPQAVWDGPDMLEDLADNTKVVAVGECGLDYFYTHSSKADQELVLRKQFAVALEYGLPMIFHIREAFDDFWPIFHSSVGSTKQQGVVHSFTGTRQELDEILERGLYVGVNGIATFTRDKDQLEVYKAIPPERMLIETDAPYLTPTPYRGKICESKHAATTLSFVAQLQGITDQQLATVTTQNARHLFNLP